MQLSNLQELPRGHDDEYHDAPQMDASLCTNSHFHDQNHNDRTENHSAHAHPPDCNGECNNLFASQYRFLASSSNQSQTVLTSIEGPFSIVARLEASTLHTSSTTSFSSP